MGAYLDRLHEQYDEIRGGVEALANRAADQNRDVTDDEQTQVDRDRARMDELQTAIGHYTELETSAASVATLRRALPERVPTTPTTGPGAEAYDIAREFPSAGDYAVTLHRAMALRDPEAIAKIERATAHQLLADNPGIVPRPVLGPVLGTLETARPFIASITTRPLPAGSFDRPTITQHVAIDKQAAEKTLTASQKMTIGKIPVTADTFAGHLNISRQDVKWTSPGILQIVFEDFASVYADATDNEACEDFAASVTTAVPIATWDVDGIYSAVFDSAANAMSAGAGAAPDTVWVSPDVWGRLGGLTSQASPVFPGINPGGGSAPLGMRLVVDKNFPASTMIQGPSRFAEWYEDVDGLMQVGEPDVLGQLVGYAGFGAFVNVLPAAFVKFTVPAPVAASSSSGGSSSSSSK